jgi:hypothetical protein
VLSSGGIFLWGIEEGSLCGKKENGALFAKWNTTRACRSHKLTVGPTNCHASKYMALSTAVTVDES